LAVQILKNATEIRDARRQLEARGLSCLDGRLASLASGLKLRKRPIVGDWLKSWDILQTARFIERQLPNDTAVLDIGAVGSEILPVLARLGYRTLKGIDLDRRVLDMPSVNISYEVANFMETRLKSGSYGAITAISVIEHGLDATRLFREVSRLLCPGGFFVASFDYWPEKVDTTGVRLFDMDWTIFSATDVTELLNVAASVGLVPSGPVNLDAGERIIHFADRRYTFGWLALQRS
jgi:SAM-dependent methyltransferase